MNEQIRNQTSLIHHLESFGCKNQKPSAADVSKKRVYWKVRRSSEDGRKMENQAGQRDRQLQIASELDLLGHLPCVALLECMNHKSLLALVTLSLNSKKGDLAGARSGHELTSWLA